MFRPRFGWLLRFPCNRGRDRCIQLPGRCICAAYRLMNVVAHSVA